MVSFINGSPVYTDVVRNSIPQRYAGGPLSTGTGNKLVAAGVKLVSVFGATEVGAPTLLFDTDDSHGPDADVKTSADWSWMQFSDRARTRWIDQGDGTFELQFLVEFTLSEG